MHRLSSSLTLTKFLLTGKENILGRYELPILTIILSLISILSYLYFFQNGLGLSYNDARSHLDIGRRVVEGLKPGLAQLGSVWLPLNHVLMVPTIWNDFMWHSGLAGALQSMISFVVTGVLIYKLLDKFGVGRLGKITGVAVFTLNLNVLYLQSTAMTELLLLATMTAGVYELINWSLVVDKPLGFADANANPKGLSVLPLIKSAFWIMLSTLVRYDGWFLLGFVSLIVLILAFKRGGYRLMEGVLIMFLSLAALGIVGWFGWNQLIFKDALYFIFGPFSAHAQQTQLKQAGVLYTQGNLWLSVKVYIYALMYNSGAFTALLGSIGVLVFLFDKKIKGSVRFAGLSLIAPFLFNVVALLLGFSVLYVNGITGNTWFNVRYGVMLLPTLAVFIGYLIERAAFLRTTLIALLIFAVLFSFTSYDAVTIDDARVGSSQKNVSQVSGWLKDNVSTQSGFVLISAASHDAIIFSSGLPMSRFIHEGTGKYWESATTAPDRWARWIIMRTYDNSDMTYKEISKTGQLERYLLVAAYPFADVYQLKDEYLATLNTEPVYGKQR